MPDPRAEWPKVMYVCQKCGAASISRYRRAPMCDHNSEDQERLRVIPASVAEELVAALQPFVTEWAAFEDQLQSDDLRMLDKAEDALRKYRSLVGDKQEACPHDAFCLRPAGHAGQHAATRDLGDKQKEETGG